MRTLTRIRQLASNEYVVQLARLQKHERLQDRHWATSYRFSTERDAELFARGIVDAQGCDISDAVHGKPHSGPRYSSGYWLYPHRGCRVPIG